MDIQKLKECVDRSPLYGNQRQGNEFDDMDQCAGKGLPLPRSIVVRTGSIVDRIGLVYDGFTLNHGGTGGTQREFPLREGEHIVRVTGSCNNFGGKVTVQSLEFTTDKGHVFAAGMPGNGGTRFEFAAKDGYAVCAVYGRADNYLRGLGFHVRKIDMNLKDPCKEIGGKMFSGMK